MNDPNDLALADLARALADGPAVTRLLELAREEDLGTRGDVTSASVIPADARSAAVLAAREPGVLAGAAVVPAVLRVFEADVTFTPAADVGDGDPLAAGRAIGRLEGRTRDVLTVERPILNLLGQLSGIATITRQYVDAVAGTGAVICETRKTTPGMRGLQKYAVRCGGGHLHRLGLHDAALYKDNHLAALPDGPLDVTLRPALEAARGGGPLRFVMVEVDTLEQLDELLRLDAGHVDIVLLDNMPPAVMREAVARRDAAQPTWRLEASGGITFETIRAVAESGVDRISVGALTHSVRCLDIGLDAV